MERSDRTEAKKTMFLDVYDDGRIRLDVQAGCGPRMLDLLAKLSRLLPRHVSELDAAQHPSAQEVVDERLWDLFIRLETVAFGDFKAEVRAAFDLEPTERDDKRAAFTEWLQTTWPMIYPKGCADDLWRNGHLATLALAWQAHIARKANIARQFQIARQSPQQAAPDHVPDAGKMMQATPEPSRRLTSDIESPTVQAALSAKFGATPEPVAHTYASTQATNCAGCGKHKHTPLRIDAMGGYVCLTCIDNKLGSLLGEFGYPEPDDTSPEPGVPEDEHTGDDLPPAGKFVIAWVEGLKAPLRAMWVPDFHLPANEDADPDWAKYSEEHDAYFAPCGWYECNHCDETNWQIHERVLAWSHLPVIDRAALAAAQAKGAAA